MSEMKSGTKVVKIIAAVISVLVVLGMIGLAIFAATIPHWGLLAVSILLAIGFSVFVYFDARYFFGPKTEGK